MEDWIYIPIPLSIAFFVQIFAPYWKNLHCIDLWFFPNHFFCLFLFLLSYGLFGVTLYKADQINNSEIFYLTWCLIFLNFVWITYFRKNLKISLIFLFLCLLFGYFVYNAIFLSELSENKNKTLFIDLYSIYMVWIGFMITILIEHSKITKKHN